MIDRRLFHDERIESRLHGQAGKQLKHVENDVNEIKHVKQNNREEIDELLQEMEVDNANKVKHNTW